MRAQEGEEPGGSRSRQVVRLSHRKHVWLLGQFHKGLYSRSVSWRSRSRARRPWPLLGWCARYARTGEGKMLRGGGMC